MYVEDLVKFERERSRLKLASYGCGLPFTGAKLGGDFQQPKARFLVAKHYIELLEKQYVIIAAGK